MQQVPRSSWCPSFDGHYICPLLLALPLPYFVHMIHVIIFYLTTFVGAPSFPMLRMAPYSLCLLKLFEPPLSLHKLLTLDFYALLTLTSPHRQASHPPHSHVITTHHFPQNYSLSFSIPSLTLLSLHWLWPRLNHSTSCLLILFSTSLDPLTSHLGP